MGFRSLAPAAFLTLAIGTLLSACEPKTMEAFPDRYVGIGVELTVEAAGARVVRVLEGGPAAEAGLKPGDVLLEVAGEPIRGWTLAEVVAALRGEPGSTVELYARTSKGYRTVTIPRRALSTANASLGRTR